MSVKVRSKIKHGDGVSKVMDPIDIDSFGGVANVAELSAIDTSLVPDAYSLRVVTTFCGWELRKSSTDTPDGITVATTLSGTGRWHRLDIDNDYFATKPAFWIDEVDGDDEALGTSAGVPIRTVTELMRRIRGRILRQATTVTVIGSITEDHTVSGFAMLGLYTYLRFVFTPTVVRSGTIATYNALNASAKTLPDLSDAGVADWTTHRQMRLVNTTAGARSGAIAWTTKNLQSSNQITTEWAKTTFVSHPYVSGSATPPNAGDTYEEQSLPTMSTSFVDVDGPLGTSVIFDGCDLTGDTVFSTLTIQSKATVFCFGCRTTATTHFASDVYMQNCLANNGWEYFAGSSDSWVYFGGLSTIPSNMSATTPSNGLWTSSGSRVTLATPVMFDQARGILVRAGAHVVTQAGAGFRRSGSNVANGHWGSHRVVKDGGTFESFGTPLFGSGATRRGASFDPDAQVSFEQEPKLTGDLSGGDFECEKVDTVRSYDETTGNYSLPMSATFANLFLALGSGGCGGQAHFRQYGLTVYQKVSFP